LAQRRQLKRSTSSNASSESNISNNSMNSYISTSTMNTTLSHLINTTPKKCPLSSGKVSEPSVFNFNDSYVNEYLKQQQQNSSQNQNLVLNRPITRSITHHNAKVNNTDSVLEVNKAQKNPYFDYNANKVNVANSTGGSFFSSSSSTSSLSSTSSDLKLFISTKNINPIKQGEQLCDKIRSSDNSDELLPLLNSPPSCKRLKRCSTIMID
jgi:hypothetical protein